MKIYRETSLADFNFWSGAKDFADLLTDSELEQVEATIEELYPEGIDETQLNDIFRFDKKAVADWLGERLDDILAR